MGRTALTVAQAALSPGSSSEIVGKLGGAFLVTTHGADDRREAALGQLSKLFGGLDSATQVTSVRIFERDIADGARGCYSSHLAIYREALANGQDVALIFEDNVAFTGLPQGHADGEALIFGNQLSWALNAMAQWDVLHLALVHSAASLRLILGPGENSHVVQVERTAPDWYGFVPIDRAPGLGTSGYLITRRAMELIVSADESGGYRNMPIDDLLACTFPGSTYAAFPVLLHRGSAPSFINPAQGAFRAVMYNPQIFRAIESAMVTTGLSSSSLVWCFLGAMAAWTFGVSLPLGSWLFRPS